jgi:hypothetical protein
MFSAYSGPKNKLQTKVSRQIHLNFDKLVNFSTTSQHNYRKLKKPIIMDMKMVNHFIKWLGILNNLSSEKLSSLKQFILTLSHYEKHKGSEFLIKVLKEVRIALENYFCKSSIIDKSFRYIRLNYAGIPIILKSAINLLKIGDPSFKMLVLSILTIGRTAKFQKCPNYNTITDVGTGSSDIPVWVYKSFSRHLAKLINCKQHTIPVFGSFHFSVKSSPLGDNCMESMMIELVSLPSDILSIIYKVGGLDLKFRMEFIISNFRDISSSIPGYKNNIDKLIKRFSSFDGFVHPIDIYDKRDMFFVFLGKYIRKMVSFAEYEGKTRIIGLCDYWSQVALEPLALQFFHILNKLPQDQTFGQADGCRELQFSSSVTYYSFDLTAFTDRFPMSIITTLLKVMYNSEFSDNVTKILSSVPFWVPDLDVFLTYSVGNPMGTKASWALTTVCHHLILYWACINLNLNFINAKYKMLGDDIVIWDKALALEYQRLIQLVGVGISSNKTIIGTSGFSFAKRIFTSSGEISPVSYRLWTHSLTNFSSMIELIKLCEERGTTLSYPISNILQETMSLAIKISIQRNTYINRLWSKNVLFLCDSTIKKTNFCNRVIHIINTYGGPSLKVFLPWPVKEYIFQYILKPIMLVVIQQDIQKFQGQINLISYDDSEEISEKDHFKRIYILAFDILDCDEMNDLLQICVPHLEINHRLIDRLLWDMIADVSSDKFPKQDFFDLYFGLKVLNYDKITRERNKSNELSPVSVSNIEISEVMIRIKDILIRQVKLQIVGLVNSNPLMVI